MRFRGLLVIFALALLVVAPASGRVLEVGFLDDPAGDGTPDITRIGVGSNATAVTATTTTVSGSPWLEASSLTTGTLRFVVLTAPLEYVLSNAALTLQIASFRVAKTIVAGKRFTATLQARRSDLEESSSAGAVVCAAKFGTKKVKVTATFPADLATCSGVVPKNAKGKVLTVTLTLDGVRVTRTASIKVR